MKRHFRKLDDQAKIFSLSYNKKDISVFRLSVKLKEKVNYKLLCEALNIVINKYKLFKVEMKNGLFWNYLIENEKEPIILKEKKFPFRSINTKENNNYLFKVTYFNKTINIDFFHILTDGNTGREFFNEIVFTYLKLKYPNEFKEILEKDILNNYENSYKKNYKWFLKRAYNPPKAYMLKGKEIENGKIRINSLSITLNNLKEYARLNKCSLSMLLVSMLAFSIYETNYKKNRGKRPINICVPINLKNYFKSKTISNFVSYMMVSLKVKSNKKYTFDDILNMVRKEFEKKLNIERILETMSSNGKAINNFFVNIVPLVLKRWMVILGSLDVKRRFTITLSNIGSNDIDDKYGKYIENNFFTLVPDWSEKLRCGVCSFKDNLVITFGTKLKDESIENKFKELLIKNNIKFNECE